MTQISDWLPYSQGNGSLKMAKILKFWKYWVGFFEPLRKDFSSNKQNMTCVVHLNSVTTSLCRFSIIWCGRAKLCSSKVQKMRFFDFNSHSLAACGAIMDFLQKCNIANSGYSISYSNFWDQIQGKAITGSWFINEKLQILKKKVEKWPKVKVVRHFGQNYRIGKKMLSADLDHNPHHRAKFGKDPMCSFWENRAETFRALFEKLSY